MNILIINYEYPPIGAGAATASWHIAHEMLKLGHRAVVLTSSFRRQRGQTVEDGVVVYRVPTIRGSADHSNTVEMLAFVLSASFAVFPILKRESIDRCIAFFSIPGGPVALLARLVNGIPYVVSLRGGDVPGNEPKLAFVHRLLAPLRRSILKHATAIVANSQGLKAAGEMADAFPVTVIPNGVDVDFFKPVGCAECGMRSEEREKTAVQESAQDQATRFAGIHRTMDEDLEHVSNSALPAPHSQLPFRFLFVGRFQPQKNLFFLLDQIAVLAKETAVPFELHLVGDGPDKARLTAHAQILGINGILKWHPWCGKDRLRQHYQEADCFVNLSLYEGMPNAVLEAMACGVPVIASRVGGNEEVVRDGKTGWLVRLGAAAELRGALTSLLSDSSIAVRVGEAAQRHAASAFSWASTTRLYVEEFGRASR